MPISSICVQRRRPPPRQRSTADKRQAKQRDRRHDPARSDHPNRLHTRSPLSPDRKINPHSHRTSLFLGRAQAEVNAALCRQTAEPSPSPPDRIRCGLRSRSVTACFDAVDRTTAVLHQRFDVLQALPREPRQIVGDGAEARIQRIGDLLERLQRIAGIGHHAVGLPGAEQCVDLGKNAVDAHGGIVEALRELLASLIIWSMSSARLATCWVYAAMSAGSLVGAFAGLLRYWPAPCEPQPDRRRRERHRPCPACPGSFGRSR